jgi:mono/diheme cytochrome c family protein
MKKIAYIFSALLLLSCGNKTEFKEGSFIPDGGNFAQESVSFSRINSEIMTPHCVKCHPGYSDYRTVASDVKKIVSAVNENRMPKNAPPLDNDLKLLLSVWDAQGTPEGSSSGDDNSDGVEVLAANWSSLSRKVLFPKCVQCHNPNGQAKFLDLSTRQKIFENRKELLNNFEDVENSFLVEVIKDEDEPMPPTWSGIPRLSDKEIEIIIEWIKLGLPN